MVLACWLATLPAAAASPWSTGGADTRRSGWTDVDGPAEVDLHLERVFPRELVFNAPPVVDEEARVLLASWGVIQGDPGADPRTWDKFDGALIRTDPDLRGPSVIEGEEVPFCYDYDGRADRTWCPDGGEVRYGNGIFDASPTLAGDGGAWAGRGDGLLYRVDLDTAEVLWTFATGNPKDPDDPDGGGHLLTSPLDLGDGDVLITTAADGPYQTNAVYRVDGAGQQVWRWPSETASHDLTFWADPALSPDGQRAYVAGWVGPTLTDAQEVVDGDGLLLAIDLSAGSGATDSERTAWELAPVTEEGEPVYVRRLAVDADGTIYVGGMAGPSHRAVVQAYDASGALLWETVLDPDDTDMVHGLALDESGGTTARVLATTGRRSRSEREGRLHALDPTTGEVSWTYDPEDDRARGAPGGIAIDGSGVAYIAVQGAGEEGHLLAVDTEGELRWKHCTEGPVEGAHPVLGPRGDVIVAEGRPQSCAMSEPYTECGRSEDLDPVVTVFYADPDDAPGEALYAELCCGCTSTPAPGAVAPLLGLLALVRRRRAR